MILDRTGFWLAQKQLERERYPWPEDVEGAKELSGEEARMLLAGIDFFKAHQAVYYQRVS
jgi:transposase